MTQLHFIALLCVYPIIVALSGVADKFATLPPEISKARSKSEELLKRKIRCHPTTNIKVNLAFTFLIYIVVYGLGAVGFIGMFFLWHVAPYLFAAAIFCKVFLLPYIHTSWYVTSGWEMTFYHIEFILDGVILVVVFFGPARHLFFQ